MTCCVRVALKSLLQARAGEDMDERVHPHSAESRGWSWHHLAYFLPDLLNNGEA